jgi:hypothetical protein
MNDTRKQRTLFGRIWRGVALGIVDSIPYLSQIVGSVRESVTEGRPETAPTFDPVTRTVTGWAGVTAFIAGIFSGVLDCEALAGILQWIGVPGF